MGRAGIGLLAAMLLASGPSVRATERGGPDAHEFLIQAIAQMSEVYIEPREPAVYAQWAIEALRGAAADAAALAACESGQVGRAGSRDPGWRRLVRRTWTCVRTLNSRLDDLALFDAVARHMLSRLDRGSDYLRRVGGSPDGARGIFRPFSAPSSLEAPADSIGPAGAIGLTITKDAAGAIMVVATLPRSVPAEANILPGDELVSVDGRSVRGMGLEEVVNALRGDIGSTARIVVRRPGSETPAELVVERRTNRPLPSGVARHGNVVVVTMTNLGTYDDAPIRDQLERLDLRRRTDVTAILIDLRGNPGGMLETARLLADMFLEGGEILSVRGQRRTERLFARGGDAAHGKPLFVLVNGQTMVGAEAVAAALADNRRATILGRRTPGRSIVRTLVYLGTERALQITSGRMIRPNGQPLESGVTPDVPIDLSPEENRGQDPVLARALRIIGERVPAVSAGRTG